MSHGPSESPIRSRASICVAQLAFILWLFFVNVFYYLQFRDVFLARIASWIHR
jgi:hypothetical protein